LARRWTHLYSFYQTNVAWVMLFLFGMDYRTRNSCLWMAWLPHTQESLVLAPLKSSRNLSLLHSIIIPLTQFRNKYILWKHYRSVSTSGRSRNWQSELVASFKDTCTSGTCHSFQVISINFVIITILLFSILRDTIISLSVMVPQAGTLAIKWDVHDPVYKNPA